MVWYGVLFAAISLLLWSLGIICLRGLNKVLIAGYRKVDAGKYKERYDVISQNRYAGKTMFLPLAFISSIATILFFFDIPFFKSSWFGVVFAIAVLSVTGLSLYSATQILGDRFKMKE